MLLWINIICTKNLHHIVFLQQLEVFVAFLYSLSISSEHCLEQYEIIFITSTSITILKISTI